MIEHPERKSEPVPAGNSPLRLTLSAGRYFWCACGRSNNQPWCDGAHKGTGIRPIRFEIQEEVSVWICLCKKTRTAPFCDGTHKL